MQTESIFNKREKKEPKTKIILKKHTKDPQKQTKNINKQKANKTKKKVQKLLKKTSTKFYGWLSIPGHGPTHATLHWGKLIFPFANGHQLQVDFWLTVDPFIFFPCSMLGPCLALTWADLGHSATVP